MPGPRDESEDHVRLRRDAQQHLEAGSAPSTQRGLGVDALTLLHRLASSPAGAPDALKLLHELQVHQVELDLQQAQLESSEREQSVDLARYRGLFDFAPFAYFVLNTEGQIVAFNLAGTRLLGLGLNGRRFQDFLTPDSRLLFAGLLDALRGGELHPGCTVQLGPGRNGAQNRRITAGSVAESDAVLLAVTECQGCSTA